MTDRTVSVILQARITDYMTKFSAASKATDDFARKVEVAKGRAAQGYHAIGVAGVAMGAVVAGGFALAVKSSADFDAKMALVRTLSHATADEMKQLSGAALTVGQAYGFTATQVADAEAELVKAGVSVADIMGGALTGALTLASAGQTDVATATEIAATAMTQFQLSGKDVPHIADLLAAGADKALGSVVDLGYALDQAGPQAHQFHVSLEETVGTLAAFAQSGQIGERGGTIFTQMLLKLAAPGKQSSDILKQLGISIYGANGQFVGMASLAGQLQTKLSGLTEQQRNHDLAVIFGQRAIRGANILYQDGAKGIEDWTNKVNTQGFAALQAAGKLDSLTGDVTKLKAALQTAFIGAGQGTQGPLRTMAQDVTKAVEVWNELPGPVRSAAEAFTLAGGAVTLAGGAALLFIPKWTAMNVALKETSIGAISAKGALLGLGKVAAYGTVFLGVAEGITAIDNALSGVHSVDVDKLTNSLVTFQQTAKVMGSLSGTFGAGLKDLGSEIRRITDPSVNKRILDTLGTLTHPFGLMGSAHPDLDQARKDFDALDKSLAGLVQSGHAPVAAQVFTELGDAAKKQGVSVKDLANLLPGYGQALDTAATAAKLAGNGVDQFGNKVGGAAKKTKTAADAAKHYSDVLHALADPLFAMNQALQGVADAQHAATVAVHKYGADSPQARQANLDLASSALDAEAAARTLAASVKNGSVSIGDARKFLKAWVADGLLTKGQAHDVAASFDILISKAQTISGLHPHMTVTADTSQADRSLEQLAAAAAALSPSSPKMGLSDFGAPVPKPSPGKSPVLNVSTSDTSGLYGSTPGSGATAGSGGSGGSGAAGRPPTVQEIVHAILTGTIPPSIDKLSKTLQASIGHLSTVVANAEQYRSTVSSGLLGYAGIANMGSTTDSFGTSTPMTKVNAYLQGRANKLQQFAHLLNRLDREGLDPDLLSQFAQVGPDAIPAMQELLSTGHRGIRRADRIEAHIRRYAGQATQTAVNDRYATALVRSVDRLPARIGREVVRGLRQAHFDVNLVEHDRKQGKKIRQHG